MCPLAKEYVEYRVASGKKYLTLPITRTPLLVINKFQVDNNQLTPPTLNIEFKRQNPFGKC